MIREGRVAGVILFAENFPSRAAGRRADRPAAGDPPPARAARPAAGDGRPGGRPGEADRRRPDRLGGSRWAPAAPPSAAEQGARTAANLRDVGVNVDLAPVLDVARPGGDIAATERGFGSSAGRGRRHRGPLRRRRCRTAASPPPPSTSPASARARRNTDFAVQRIGLSKATLRAVDEAPYRRFVAAGGEMVMLSTAIYPAFSPKPAAFARPIATGELRDRLGFEGVSITDALGSVAVARLRRARRRPAWRRPAAGTDLLLFTDYRAAADAPGAPCCAGCAPGR